MSNIKNKIITISGDNLTRKDEVIQKIKQDIEFNGNKVVVYKVDKMVESIVNGMALSTDVTDLDKYRKIGRIASDYISKREEEINSKERPNQVFIFDSILACKNVQNALSVRLSIDEDEEIQRQKYKEIFDVDILNPDNYKLMIDTTYSTVEDIAQVIEDCLRLEEQGQKYSKNWTTPKKMLPIQNWEYTINKGSYYTLDKMMHVIKNEGYSPSQELIVEECNGKFFILDGHHRNFALGRLGKTLVPYYVISSSKNIKSSNEEKRKQDIESRESFLLNKNKLHSYERFFDKNGKHFTYDEIYPGIYELIEKYELQLAIAKEER